MTISSKKFIDILNSKLPNSNLSNEEIELLVNSSNSLLSSQILTVDTTDALPPPAENKGRFAYIRDLDIYRYSNGEEWSKDYSSQPTFYNQLWSWGSSSSGAIGNGECNAKSSPVSVIGGFNDWIDISISAVSNHATALRSNGTIWTWGSGVNGQLGNNCYVDFASPVSVLGGFTDWCAVSAGANHNAAVRTNGTLWTWGSNSGQLGDGTVITRSSPVSVVGGFTDWCSVSAGWFHTAAIRTNCTMWAWGANTRGELGTNNNIQASSPVSVAGTFSNNDWVKVSVGTEFSVALKNNSTLWTWGAGNQGQLGDGYAVTRSSPVSVVGGFTDWCAVDAGTSHAVAIRTNGTLWSWGLGGSGRLGDGYAVNRSSPVSVAGGFCDWCAVSAGYSHTAAIRTNGTLWTWGLSNQGRLGDGYVVDRSSPVSVVGGFTDWCAVDASNDMTAAIRTNGTLWTWGSGSNAQLGNNCTSNFSSPVSVVGGFTDWCNVKNIGGSVIAIRTNGTIWAWGNNSIGQLGDNTATSRSSPVSVVGGFSDWCNITGGNSSAFAIRSNGTIWAWGQNSSCQLGAGTLTIIRSPILTLSEYNDWCDLSASSTNVAAIRSNGTLWIFRSNSNGALGNNLSSLNNCYCVPNKFKTPYNDFVKLKIGGAHALGLRKDNTLWTWGSGSQGQLGNNSTANHFSPVSVVGGFTDWCEISVGNYHSVAIRTDGVCSTLWTWGCSSCGRLGDGYVVNRSSPVSVVGGFTDWCAVSAGSAHTAALRTNGTLWTWGNGNSGQLGIDSTICVSSPVSVVGGFTDWCAVSAGENTTAAVRTNGTLWTWGCGLRGILGDGYAVDRSSPVSVVGGFTDWCAVSAGSAHTAALRTNGTLWTWGNGNSGQLGIDSTICVSSPVSVVGGFTDWCAVNAGFLFTAAIRTDGSLWTWGFNSSGQLGNGTNNFICSPVNIASEFNDWCSIAAHTSGRTTVAIRQNYDIYGWGCNSQNVLLAAELISTNSPVNIVGDLVDWCSVSTGWCSSVAIRTDGSLWTWGNNYRGQAKINVNQNASTLSPVRVETYDLDWCKISMTDQLTFAIKTNGTLWSWGSCMLHDGKSNIDNLGIGLVDGNFIDWCAVSVGLSSNQHTAAIRTNGSLWSWGCGFFGQLGDNCTSNRSSPVSVVGGFTDWCAVSVGANHTVAIRTNCTLWTWGYGGQGKLGDGTVITRSSPVSVVGGFTDWCAVDAGDSHTAAVRTNGSLWTWGCGSQGRLGDGYTVNRSSPVSVIGGFTDWCAVSAGSLHTAALRTNGTLWSWGNGGQGRLGDNSTINRSSPVSVLGGFTDWCAISAGYTHTAALRTNGSLWTWGCGGSGRLGDGYAVNRFSPVSVVGGFTDWCAVSAGIASNTALRANGTLWTWGDTTLSIGINPNIFSPVKVIDNNEYWSQVSVERYRTFGLTCQGLICNLSDDPKILAGGFTDWCFLNSGAYHSAAIRSDGSLWAWGSSAQGRLGSYITTGVSDSPVSVIGGFSDWVKVSAGRQNTVALRCKYIKGF